MPKASPMMVRVGEREVRVSSPDRVIFEATDRTAAITKLQVCEYFAAVGEPLMAALGARPTAMERWPDGWREGMRLSLGPQDSGGDGFYQKRLPRGAPEYVETVRVTFPSGRTADELCPTEPAAFVWAAQMGTLTFHPWPVRAPDVDRPDELRIDLDPGDGATFGDVRRVAEATRELLEEHGLRAFVKTSGSRGLHVYARIHPVHTFDDVRHAAIGVGRELESRDVGATTSWWKELRPPGSVFIDFNQNLRDRTVAGAWSIRARAGAPVSAPVSWSRLPGLRSAGDFDVESVPSYLQDGDPWATMNDTAYDLAPLLDLWEASEGGELSFPPDYPKQPNEPPRVQPSRKVAEHWDEDGNRR